MATGSPSPAPGTLSTSRMTATAAAQPAPEGPQASGSRICAKESALERSAVFGSASRRNIMLQRWIHVTVLQHLFQVRPYAQIGDVIGNRRETVRHMLRDDDHVPDFYIAARVSHHRAAAGWSVENRGYFVVCSRTLPIDDGATADQRAAARYYDVALGSIVVKDSVRTRRASPFL